MKFNVDSYHFKLLRDYDRLSAFKEAIDDYAKGRADVEGISPKGIAFDLGCGSGVLSYFAKDYMDEIIAIEINNSTYHLAEENLKEFDKIKVFNADILRFDFSKLGDKADLIICEMLDTALIDEEEVPALNYAKDYLKKDGVIIPQGIINAAEPVFMNNHFIQYEDDEYSPIYIALGKPIFYSEFDFREDIDPHFSAEMEFWIYDRNDLNQIGIEELLSGENYEKFNFKENFNMAENRLKINGIKISSFTKLNDDVICGPTPMMNPSILIPIEETEVSCGDAIRVRIEYIMGGGVETIRTEVL